MTESTSAALGASMVRDRLERAHVINRAAPLVGPDERGVFTESWIEALLRREVLVAVVDTNWLWADLKYAFLRGQRTVLITAANSRTLRLFCAEHVVREVEEHGGEWALQFGVSDNEYRRRWAEEYLPFLQVIPHGSIPRTILSPAELERLAALDAIDPDDAPSVILSLALGAIFLSKDKPAFHAVYGPDANYAAVRGYLDVLMAGSNSSELGQMLFSFYLVPAAAGYGIVQLVRLLAGKSPWLLGGLAAILALAALRTPTDRYQKIGSGLYDIATVLSEVQRPYDEYLERFRQAAPAIPTWADLAPSIDRPALRLRACLHALAHSREAVCSAREVAWGLPEISAGKSDTVVRQTLNEYDCFARPVQGKWKVGHTFSYAEEA